MSDHSELDAGDEDWDFEADDEFRDEVGEDFRGDEDESCKCLFLPDILPTAQDALVADKEKLGFDFHGIRKKLSKIYYGI